MLFPLNVPSTSNPVSALSIASMLLAVTVAPSSTVIALVAPFIFKFSNVTLLLLFTSNTATISLTSPLSFSSSCSFKLCSDVIVNTELSSDEILISLLIVTESFTLKFSPTIIVLILNHFKC